MMSYYQWSWVRRIVREFLAAGAWLVVVLTGLVFIGVSVLMSVLVAVTVFLILLPLAVLSVAVYAVGVALALLILAERKLNWLLGNLQEWYDDEAGEEDERSNEGNKAAAEGSEQGFADNEVSHEDSGTNDGDDETSPEKITEDDDENRSDDGGDKSSDDGGNDDEKQLDGAVPGPRPAGNAKANEVNKRRIFRLMQETAVLMPDAPLVDAAPQPQEDAAAPQPRQDDATVTRVPPLSSAFTQEITMPDAPALKPTQESIDLDALAQNVLVQVGLVQAETIPAETVQDTSAQNPVVSSISDAPNGPDAPDKAPTQDPEAGEPDRDGPDREVPWGYFYWRLSESRAAELQGIQADATGVMRAAHDLLQVLPPPPRDEELKKAFAFAWNDVVMGEVTEADFPGLMGDTVLERRSRMAWRRIEAYLPDQTVHVGAPVEADGSRRWYAVERFFTGEATMRFMDDGGSEQGSLRVSAYVDYAGEVVARVWAPHPLSGLRVALEPPDNSGSENEKNSSANDSRGESLGNTPLGGEPPSNEPHEDKPLVMRVPADEDVLVEDEVAQRFLAGCSETIVGDLEYALMEGTWWTPRETENDEEGGEW